jgi:hypothetical protein
MTKRIEEFVRQAWSYADKQQTTEEQWFVEYNKKFAELVAEECMDIIMQNMKYATGHKWPAVELANVCLYEIEKTFGVENGKETVSS